MYIRYLCLKEKVTQLLIDHGIETVEGLRAMTAEDLLRLTGFGRAALHNVRTCLANRLLSLKGEESAEVLVLRKVHTELVAAGYQPAANYLRIKFNIQ